MNEALRSGAVDPVLQATGLVRRFREGGAGGPDVTVLHGVDLRIHRGEIAELTQRFALFHPCALFVQGTAEAWECLWKKVPPPGWHDLFALHKRGDKGNTRVVVEHDEDTIRRADHIIDIGPSAGKRGGRLVAQGSVADVTGAQPAFSTGGGTSDARFIKNYCPVAELGLVGESMHKVDEQVPVADIATLTRIYLRLLERYFDAVPA